jgi:hypothetical protein
MGELKNKSQVASNHDEQIIQHNTHLSYKEADITSRDLPRLQLLNANGPKYERVKFGSAIEKHHLPHISEHMDATTIFFPNMS